MTIRITLLTVAVLLIAALSASAQTPVFVTPSSSITFTASPDHSQTALDGTQLVTGYKANYCQQSAPTNCTSVPLGKPTPNASNVISIPNFFGQLTPNILWTVVVQATGPGGDSDPAAGNAPFGLAIATKPRPAGNVTVIR